MACAWAWPERSPYVQPPRAALPRGGVAVRPDVELWGSLRLIRPWSRPQLFITSAEHSASTCAWEGGPLREEPPGRVQPRPDTWLAR